MVVGALAADQLVTVITLACCFIGMAFAILYWYQLSLIELTAGEDGASTPFNSEIEITPEQTKKIVSIYDSITEGAEAFLWKEYQYIGVFVIVFSILLFLCLGSKGDEGCWMQALFTVIAFVVGSLTSVISGYIGMKVGVYSNARVTVQAARGGYKDSFNTGFKGGVVMGFALVSMGVFVLFVLINCFNLYWTKAFSDVTQTKVMYEAIAGYGLGGSSVALFGRVGGGIYTKAADVGADLCGKVLLDGEVGRKLGVSAIDEDDARNPAVIADNVGDNVGDIAGMGADLFGSFAESSCAAMVIASQSPDLYAVWPAMSLPLVISSVGIIVCLITSFTATHMCLVNTDKDIEVSLKRQINISTLLVTPVAFIVCYYFLPSEFHIAPRKSPVKNWYIFCCIGCGLYSGLIIGNITEYFTSHSYTPVREVAFACRKGGAATNIIYGLALGYKSVIIPCFCIAITIYVSYSLAAMFGIACAALGILSTLSIGLTIDAYGPICDNAGGIAEMAELDPRVREMTDALDAAGNTTAAIGKGFAIGSAALVSLALFGAFVTTVNLTTVDILQPFQFAGLLVGAMLPYWFSAMTVKSVGYAAEKMVDEVKRQWLANPDILRTHDVAPDYQKCISISTAASLQEMIAPGALVMITPIVVGFGLGVECLAGVLAGSLVSGVQVAISASNTGGAWDNAKKFITAGDKRNLFKFDMDTKKELPSAGEERKISEEEIAIYKDAKKAAVIGDTVGDPLKDTSGPSLNILIKLSAIISVVLAPSFPTVEAGGYLVQLLS